MPSLVQRMVLPEPMPHATPRRYEPVVWPDGPAVSLRGGISALDVDLAVLLEERQTCRDFSNPLDIGMLGDFLWLVCRSRSSSPSPFGPDQESRPYPSAGAMHPIHVLVSRKGHAWERFDPVEHCLRELPDTEDSALSARSAAGHLLDVRQGILLTLVAEPGKTAAKYSAHESLVSRDAGVIIGYMSIVAEALRLPFCPLGITGHEALLPALPGNEGQLMPIGLALIAGTVRHS